MIRRIRRWRYERLFVRAGFDRPRARLLAKIAAGLDVPPKLLVAPSPNHWSAWTADPVSREERGQL